MPDEKFFSAFVGSDAGLLGRQLKPYCLAHASTLESLGCPLVDGNPGDILPVHYLTAAKICSCGPGPNHDPFAEIRASLCERPTKWDSLEVSRLALDAGRLEECAGAWATYSNVLALAPEVWHRETGGKPLTAPWPLGYVTCLMTECGISPHLAWFMPLAQILWYVPAISERRGGAEFVTDKWQRAIDERKRKLAQKAAGLKRPGWLSEEAAAAAAKEAGLV